MAHRPVLLEITPTVCLTGPETDLRQLVRVRVGNPGAEAAVQLQVQAESVVSTSDLGPLPAGESEHEVFVPEAASPGELTFALHVAGTVADRKTMAWQPPPHFRVHVVQHSHHDVGYTNLSSTVLREHCDFLDSVLDLADATADFPDEARFRLVIEQAWSLQEFARRAPAARVARLGELLRSGQVELTALFGNMTTEIMGPEQLVRALYPSRRLAREFGCALTTAEHNDVPGMSWGLAQVLTEAGIGLFCPQLPRYWNWCDPPLQTFWDEATLFPQGQPGAFWWEAPSGRRVLLWDSCGSGGDVRPDLPGLAERLRSLAAGGYPYRAVYWPVRGGARDNSPYIGGFAETVCAWNERWTYPRLFVSTNDRFYRDLQPELPADLPVFRGELPGQDYPVGSTSTAAATAANRGNHVQLLTAERLATMAAATTDFHYPTSLLDEAYEDTLWYDEHTWGHHFPCGPTAQASELEKQVHAYRPAAIAHDVTTRALARIADHVQLPGQGFYLVVFNPLPHTRTAPVVAPLREIENAGSTMTAITDPEHPEQPSFLRGVALTDRWHAHPSAAIVKGHFDLVDLSDGETVDFQITEVDGPDAPVPYAPQRHGLASGGKRYGFFEGPSGLSRDLHFVARDLPACGYKTYELRPHPEPPPPSRPPRRTRAGAPVIENEFYRVQADRETGRITSLIDREADRELLDPQAPQGFGQLVVRAPEGVIESHARTECRRVADGPVYQSLELSTSAPGHPHVRQALGLHRGVKRLELAVRVLKDPTPLLDAHLAFPFLLPDPEFRYEGVLAAETPLADYLPGAYWDALAVQNWVRVSGGGLSLLWSSLDAPMVSLGGLHPGYVSPAHSCLVPERAKHPPGTAEQLAHSWIYSTLFANNFGTNFAVSQTGTALFRYVLTTRAGRPEDAEAARLGWEAVTPCETIFTEPSRPGRLPLTGSLLSLTGDALVLLAWKRAEDGGGLILRLWNPAPLTAEATVEVRLGPLGGVSLTSVTEDDAAVLPEGAELTGQSDGGFAIRVGPRALATIRLLPRP